MTTACAAFTSGVVPGRAMFTRHQLLNKQDRILTDLTSAELAAEDRKQF